MASDKKAEFDPELEPRVARLIAHVFEERNRPRLDEYIEKIGGLLANAARIRQLAQAEDFEARIAAVRE